MEIIYNVVWYVIVYYIPQDAERAASDKECLLIKSCFVSVGTYLASEISTDYGLRSDETFAGLVLRTLQDYKGVLRIPSR